MWRFNISKIQLVIVVLGLMFAVMAIVGPLSGFCYVIIAIPVWTPVIWALIGPLDKLQVQSVLWSCYVLVGLWAILAYLIPVRIGFAGIKAEYIALWIVGGFHIGFVIYWYTLSELRRRGR